MDPLKEREEQKRERAYDPVLRWKQIQEAITWAEANMKPEFRRNKPRWHKHEKLENGREASADAPLQRPVDLKTKRDI